MRRRRGRTIGTLLIGTCVLGASLFAALGGQPTWRPLLADRSGIGISIAGRDLLPGAIVLAGDGTEVGSVSRIWRRADGHVEKIAIATMPGLNLPSNIVVRGTRLAIEEGRVRLASSVGELHGAPDAMMDTEVPG
jgi:hypothetical protein